MSVRDIMMAAAGNAAEESLYVEDVFSTYLYTGTGSNQTITNGIDLAGEGGMVWIKGRSVAYAPNLVDTVRGTGYTLSTTNTSAQTVSSTVGLTAFNSNGFTTADNLGVAASGANFASWTFREVPNFFDVVTYTGNGVARTISHSLGSVPGMVIVKCTSTTGNWAVYHNGQTSASYYTKLNLTDAQASDTTVWNGTAPTSSVFSVGTSALTNSNGATYVAYLFAHNAGGFGASGTDSIVSCGSFTTDSSGNATVNLGWEPQYILAKPSSTTGNWHIADVMRGASQTAFASLAPNTTAAENTSTGAPYLCPTATGFTTTGYWASTTLIYMAIRRGPMRTPTDPTKVFSPLAVNAATGTQQTTSFPVDMQWAAVRAGNPANATTSTRLIGVDTNGSMSSNYLVTSSTVAEATGTSASITNTWWNTGFKVPSSYNSISTSFWNFQRAPGFFDVVCYGPGSGTSLTVNHNLGVVPELLIYKSRSSTGQWVIQNGSTNYGFFNSSLFTSGSVLSGLTSTSFTLNVDANTYVAYLFASCPGVSKVGSYTGTGATQTISCGFTGGARFVLIKRTDFAGNWYVWDTARGMVSGTDPSLLLNSTAAEVNANSVYTTTGGFQIVTTAPGINTSGGSYIYLAVA